MAWGCTLVQPTVRCAWLDIGFVGQRARSRFIRARQRAAHRGLIGQTGFWRHAQSRSRWLPIA